MARYFGKLKYIKKIPSVLSGGIFFNKLTFFAQDHFEHKNTLILNVHHVFYSFKGEILTITINKYLSLDFVRHFTFRSQKKTIRKCKWNWLRFYEFKEF